MSEELKPCPWCKTNTRLVVVGEHECFVKCNRCLAFGPSTFPSDVPRGAATTAADRARAAWNAYADTLTPAPSPWHDAAETPRPCELCLVEIETREKIYYYALYWDAFIDGWRDEDGEEFSSCFAYKWLRYQYLDTSKGEVQP